MPIDADVTDRAGIAAAVAGARPDVVVNCAAFVDVDGAEDAGMAGAFAVNAVGAACVARAAAAAGAHVIYLSTNYVFSGTAARPYEEDDPPRPINVYGASKLAGEFATMAVAPTATIVRTSALYGDAGSRAKGGSFVARILAGARAGRPLAVVADQFIAPTSCRHLAVALGAVVQGRPAGVVHLTNAGACTWWDLAVETLRLAHIRATVERTATEQAPGRALRPPNGLLGRSRTDALGLPALAPWQEALAEYLASDGDGGRGLQPSS